MGIFMAVAAPSLLASLSRSRVVAAARDLEQLLAHLRSAAISERCDMALRLTWSGGHYTFATYRDGDADGVRADDIAAGRDALVAGPRDLGSRYEGVDFGLIDSAIPEVPPGRGSPPPFGDPVRFGRSDIVTFTPRGTASSGSLYVSDGRGAVVAIVLYGATGRIRTCRFERDLWAWIC